MKNIKILFLLLLLLNVNTGYAYEQSGYVKTIGRPNKKGQRIAGVSIYPKAGQGNSTVSNANGEFSLVIKGNSFYISKVQKMGMNSLTLMCFQKSISVLKTKWKFLW